MRFHTPLISGRLVKRYKRFLADVMLDDGQIVTAHCANPGAMIGLKDEGLKVWLEPNSDPKKKLKYGWRLAEFDNGTWAGIDTSAPNRIVRGALQQKKIAGLADYESMLPEQKYGTNSRIDFLLKHSGLPDVYLEVKNVHLLRRGTWAEFPDSVTKRGTKHLHELATQRAQGHRAIMLYVVQHTGCDKFTLADDLDPEYAAAFRRARGAGVEMLCYGTHISVDQITLASPLPIYVD